MAGLFCQLLSQSSEMLDQTPKVLGCLITSGKCLTWTWPHKLYRLFAERLADIRTRDIAGVLTQHPCVGLAV